MVEFNPSESIFEQPEKERSMPQKFKEAVIELFQNPTSRWTLIAGSFRFFGGYCIAFFKPIYFQKNYPEYDSQFGVINAGLSSVLGFISAVSGGVISDKKSNR